MHSVRFSFVHFLLCTILPEKSQGVRSRLLAGRSWGARHPRYLWPACVRKGRGAILQENELVDASPRHTIAAKQNSLRVRQIAFSTRGVMHNDLASTLPSLVDHAPSSNGRHVASIDGGSRHWSTNVKRPRRSTQCSPIVVTSPQANPTSSTWIMFHSNTRHMTDPVRNEVSRGGKLSARKNLDKFSTPS